MKSLRNGSMKGRILARVVSLIAVFSMICGIFPGGVLTVHAAEYSLASLSQDFKATNGSVLTGTLGANHKISIADGATVTLKDATIKKVGDGDTDYPGITCMGDATIILEGENTVEAFAYRYPGIYIPDGNTLTIQGTGTLNVTGKQGCGIGGGLDLKKSGNVLIKGGTIIAEGGYYCAAIGQAVRGQCGDITITGGDVTARGGDSAAGIGAGEADTGGGTDDDTCGDINITGGRVYAYGGDYAAGIGSGKTLQNSNGSDLSKSVCGNISITGGEVLACGGDYAPGIGSGYTYVKDAPTGGMKQSGCGTITISGESTTVIAKGGKNAPEHIGTGFNSECGDVNIAAGMIARTTDEQTVIQMHVHEWSFSAEGPVLTATCANTDGTHQGELTSTLTIKRPLHSSYGDGFAKEATVTGSIEGVAIPEVKYSRRGGQALAAAPEEVGLYTASITLGDATASVDYEIEGIEPYIITVPTASAIIYGQTLADSDLTGGSADVAGTFAWADGSVKPSVSDNNSTEYDVVFTPSVANYKSVKCKVKLGVSKAEPVVTAPVAKSLKYNGSEQELVNAGSTDGGTMYYAVLTTADAAPIESAYKSTIPTAKEAGTYYVWYKVIGDEKHTDSDAASVKVTISEAVPGEDPEPTPTPVYEITVSENETVSITIGVDGERELKADLGGQSISWSSSDEKVVTVTADGKIKAVWSGTAKVTGVAADGRSVVCEVTVAQKYDDDTADHVRVSPDDFNEFVRPEKQEHKRITKEAVSVTLKDGSNVKVDVSVNYINAVAYTGKVIKPADDLEVKYELDDILKAAGISDVKADELIKIKYTSRNKDANKNASFYAKFTVVKGAKKKFNLTNDQIKALKAILKEVNKAMKKEPVSYTINKASLADMAEMKVNAKTKDGALTVKNGKIKNFKGVFVKYKASDTKAVKLKAKAGYDIEVLDAASAKLKVSGKKNYTGYVIKQANN